MPVIECAAVRDLYRRQRSEEACAAAERAVGRLLAGIERGEAVGGQISGYSRALRRHGVTIRREGGAALLRLVFDRLCRGVPTDRASRRFDLLSLAWADLISTEVRP